MFQLTDHSIHSLNIPNQLFLCKNTCTFFVNFIHTLVTEMLHSFLSAWPQIFWGKEDRYFHVLKPKGWFENWINVCTKHSIFYFQHQILDLVWESFPRLWLQGWQFTFLGFSLDPQPEASEWNGTYIYCTPHGVPFSFRHFHLA